jgi:hypothetical protein
MTCASEAIEAWCQRVLRWDDVISSADRDRRAMNSFFKGIKFRFYLK